MIEVHLMQNGKVVKSLKCSQYRLKSTLAGVRALANTMPRKKKDTIKIVVS